MANQAEFTAEAALKFLNICCSQGIEIWLDGGWGVDALLQKQTRPHSDLDITIEQRNLKHLTTLLVDLGYRTVTRDDSNDWNFVLCSPKNRQIDFHVITLDTSGNGIYGPVENGLFYPREALTGTGSIDGQHVNCLTASYQIISHSGYTLKQKDFADLIALRETFNRPDLS